MVVLDATALGGALLGGPYAQGAPQLKLVQKRYLGIHHWLSPVATKDLKEQIVSKQKCNNNRIIKRGRMYIPLPRQ